MFKFIILHILTVCSLCVLATEKVQRVDLDLESPLYASLDQFFSDHYQDIASDQLEDIDLVNGNTIWGGLNHFGLSYNKDFATFSVELKRQVAPDLFHDSRYIVTDTFDIYVKASVLQEKFRGLVNADLSTLDKAALAGLTFKRSYRFNHYANSYIEAVSFNLERLFFSFLNFRSNNFLKIKEGEYLSKEDFLGVFAGGKAYLPLGSGLSAHVGALAEYESISKVELYREDFSDTLLKEKPLKFNYEKSRTKSLQVSAGVVGHFFNLLQLTILSADFTYSDRESYKSYLSLPASVVSSDSNGEVLKEVREILLQRRGDLSVLAPYVVSEEYQKSMMKKMKYAFLLWGRMRDERTTQIDITKDKITKSFFRHNLTYKKYRQNAYDWLLNGFFKGFFKVNGFVKNENELLRTLRFEYESQTNLMESRKDLVMSSKAEDKKLSIHFLRDMSEDFSRTRYDRAMKSAINMIENFAGANPLIVDKIKDEKINKSIQTHVYTTIDEAGIRYFNSLSYSQLKRITRRTCESKSIFSLCGWRLRRSLKRYLKERDATRISYHMVKSCDQSVRRFRSRFRRYRMHKRCLRQMAKKSIQNARKEIPLWRLKDFLSDVLIYSRSKVSYYDYFTHKGVHSHGQIRGLKNNINARPLFHFFSEGFFQGLGVVSKYKRNNIN